HIVTIRVKEDGKAISSSNNFYQSKRATRELEKKYNLHTAERGQAISEIPLRKVNASEGDVKKQIANTVKAVVRGYHYQTLGELRAVLSLYNIDVEETRGMARNREYHGLVYSATDDNGNRVGNPFKASKIGPSVGYEAVQKRFAWSKKQIAEGGIAAALKEKILPILAASSNVEDFKARLQQQGMDVVFRYTDTGRIYGATFIDHDSRTVLNGSRMCKELSANALEQHFNSMEGDPHTQQQGQTDGQGQSTHQGTEQGGSGGQHSTGSGYQQSQPTPTVSDYNNSHSEFDGFGLFTTDNPAVDPAEEEFRRRMQRKRKKRRGPKL
ncbi:MAG: Relaxase/mobilization nuclease domain, partial [bacterium P3]